MSIVRLQGRPKRGETSVGREKIICGTIALLRRGDKFRSSKELAARLGITPALLNYYFGKKLDFVDRLVVEVVDSHRLIFSNHLDCYLAGCEASLEDALSALVNMHVQDRGFVAYYNNLSDAAFNRLCCIASMKQKLEFALGEKITGSVGDCMPAFIDIIWATCSAALDYQSGVHCRKLALRVVTEAVSSAGNMRWIEDDDVRQADSQDFEVGVYISNQDVAFGKVMTKLTFLTNGACEAGGHIVSS